MQCEVELQWNTKCKQADAMHSAQMGWMCWMLQDPFLWPPGFQSSHTDSSSWRRPCSLVLLPQGWITSHRGCEFTPFRVNWHLKDISVKSPHHEQARVQKVVSLSMQRKTGWKNSKSNVFHSLVTTVERSLSRLFHVIFPIHGKMFVAVNRFLLYLWDEYLVFMKWLAGRIKCRISVIVGVLIIKKLKKFRPHKVLNMLKYYALDFN